MITYEETKYGFRYGAATITRCCSDEKKGWVVLLITTPKHTHKKHGEIQIYITKTGKVRISNNRGEWTPPKGDDENV